MSKLYVYGDSWPFGAGLADYNQAFPYLMQSILKCEVVNKSFPATSIDHLVYYFLSDLDNNMHNEGDKILFCLTGRTRSMCFVDDKPFELHPRNDDDYARIYYKYLHSDQLDTYNLTKNILLCSLLCKEKGLKDYFVSNWDTIPASLQGRINLCSSTLASILHPERNQKINSNEYGDIFYESEYMDSTQHPTALGHLKIAEELSKWINYH